MNAIIDLRRRGGEPSGFHQLPCTRVGHTPRHVPDDSPLERPCDSETVVVRPSVYVPSAAQRDGWWSRLSPGQKVDLVLGAAITGILIAALMMVPG